jgi:hypothetical protein
MTTLTPEQTEQRRIEFKALQAEQIARYRRKLERLNDGLSIEVIRRVLDQELVIDLYERETVLFVMQRDQLATSKEVPAL